MFIVDLSVLMISERKVQVRDPGWVNYVLSMGFL